MRQELHSITLAALALLLAACGVTMPEPTTLTASCRSTPPPAAAAETLHFASNRAPQCYRDGRYGFSGLRSHETVYGTSVLPVGDNGWRDHFSQRDEKPAWLDRLARASTGRPLLVYIHGYSNGFENALQRGQVLSRLAQPGTEVVVASWPSRNKFESYTYDEATIEWTTDEFEALLRDLVEVSGDITVVAHSMGNRAAIAAVVNLERERHAKAAHIRRMVLASPDVDRDHALRRGGAAGPPPRKRPARAASLHLVRRSRQSRLTPRARPFPPGLDRLPLRHRLLAAAERPERLPPAREDRPARDRRHRRSPFRRQSPRGFCRFLRGS